MKWVFKLRFLVLTLQHSATRYTVDCDQGLLFLAMEKVPFGVTRSIIIRRQVSISSSVGIHMSGRQDSVYTSCVTGCLISCI